MELIEILNERKDVKVVVTLKDLISFTEYLLDKGRTNSDSDNLRKEFGGLGFAMRITGLAKSTIYNICSRGEIPHHKNGKLYFSKEELHEWMKSKSEELDVIEYLK